MLAYKFLLCCMLITYVHAQIIYIPVTQIVCQDYTTYEECINGDALACAWCDSTQQCGTCNYCTGDLYLISDSMCPDEISECSKMSNCIGGEFVMFGFGTILTLLILCGTVWLTKILVKDENVLLKIFGVICFIYTLIGLAVLIGGGIVWIISIF